MEIVAKVDDRVLAERLDYLWGEDFNRGAQCLGSSWFDDNTAFAERVLGPKALQSRLAEGRGSRQHRIVKAVLVKTEDVDRTLGGDNQQDALPPGSQYDYNNRTIRLKGGSFRMLGYGNDEPIPIVATTSQEQEVSFFMLPQGWLRNHPIRLLLINTRMETGEELRNTFVQVPPGVNWQNGWGFDKADVSTSLSKVSFAIYGEKDKSTRAFYNQGRYRKRYVFEAPWPSMPE